MELKEALEEIIRRAPALLDEPPDPIIQDGKKLNNKSRYPDDHEFVVSIPAWIFRTLKNDLRYQNQKT